MVFGTAKRRTQTMSSRARQMILGLVALVSVLTGCQGQMEGGTEADATVTQSVTGAVAATNTQAFPMSEPGAVVIDDSAADFKLEQGEAYHGMVRTTRAWEHSTGFQGTSLTAPSGPSTSSTVGSAAFAQWSTTASKGSVDVYAYVAPKADLSTWAVYCIFNQYSAAPTCTHLDQSAGEARWVFLGNVEATGAVQVVLDPTASPADGTQVQADAVAFVPAA